jgi:predicted cupin superfamily sugar epimerase
MPTAAEIIARLELKPHPEGGYYRETFRDSRREVAPGFDFANSNWRRRIGSPAGERCIRESGESVAPTR